MFTFSSLIKNTEEVKKIKAFWVNNGGEKSGILVAQKKWKKMKAEGRYAAAAKKKKQKN